MAGMTLIAFPLKSSRVSSVKPSKAESLT